MPCIKDGVDILRNNKSTAPIDVHSSYVTFDHTTLPSDVKTCYLARQKPTHINIASTLVPFLFKKDAVGPLDSTGVTTIQQHFDSRRKTYIN